MDSNPFLSLPAELRNHIYDLVAREQDLWTIGLPVHRGAPGYALPSLAYVCHQIRDEFLSVFLALHACVFHLYSARCMADAQTWLDVFGHRTVPRMKTLILRLRVATCTVRLHRYEDIVPPARMTVRSNDIHGHNFRVHVGWPLRAMSGGPERRRVPHDVVMQMAYRFFTQRLWGQEDPHLTAEDVTAFAGLVIRADAVDDGRYPVMMKLMNG